MANINVELGDLRAFVALAEHGSFSAAARERHLSQPAFSRRIAKLESHLDTRLVERTTRRVTLTAAGRDFARKARQVLNAFEESLLGLGETGGLQGEVTLACVPTAINRCLPDVLRAYHRQHPRIRLRVLDRGASGTLSSVVQGEADFGINYLGAEEPGVDFRVLFEESFVVACRPDHPLAPHPRLPWVALRAHACLGVTRASGNRLLLDQAGVPELPVPFCEADHVRTVVDLVAAGLGIAVVPQLAIPRSSGLCAIPLDEPPVSRTLGLIKRRGRVLSPAAERLFQTFAEQSFAAC